MAYSDVAILRDANGDPIPQYYDPVAGVFKPAHGDENGGRVQLYGSIVQLGAASQVVAAGANLDIDIDCRNVREINVFVTPIGTWNYMVESRWEKESGTLIASVLSTTLLPSNSGYRKTGWQAVESPETVIRLTNEDASQQTVAILVMGRK